MCRGHVDEEQQNAHAIKTRHCGAAFGMSRCCVNVKRTNLRVCLVEKVMRVLVLCGSRLGRVCVPPEGPVGQNDGSGGR